MPSFFVWWFSLDCHTRLIPWLLFLENFQKEADLPSRNDPVFSARPPRLSLLIHYQKLKCLVNNHFCGFFLMLMILNLNTKELFQRRTFHSFKRINILIILTGRQTCCIFKLNLFLISSTLISIRRVPCLKPRVSRACTQYAIIYLVCFFSS